MAGIVRGIALMGVMGVVMLGPGVAPAPAQSGGAGGARQAAGGNTDPAALLRDVASVAGRDVRGTTRELTEPATTASGPQPTEPVGGTTGTYETTTTVGADGTVATTVTISLENGPGLSKQTRADGNVQACPDATGTVRGKVVASEITIAEDLNLLLAFTGEFVGRVDDGAYLTKFEVTSHGESTDRFGPNPGGITWDTGKSGKARVVGRQTKGDELDIKRGDKAVRDAAEKLLKVAEKRWRSGACVRIEADPDGGPVEPKSLEPVKVDVSSKVDGEEIRAKVTATLESGTKSIAPAQRVAPGIFRYETPDEKKKEGLVRYESVSKRGIGVLNSTFTTDVVDLRIDAAAETSGHVTAIKCGGVPGHWEVHYVAGTTIRADYIFDLPDTAGPAGSPPFTYTKYQDVPTVDGGFYTVSYTYTATAVFYPASNELFFDRFLVPVQEGSFCKDGKPTP